MFWFAEKIRHSALRQQRHRFRRTFPGFITNYTNGVVDDRNINIILSAWDEHNRHHVPFAPQRVLDKGYENIHLYFNDQKRSPSTG
jgi:hypothetical protein